MNAKTTYCVMWNYLHDAPNVGNTYLMHIFNAFHSFSYLSLDLQIQNIFFFRVFKRNDDRINFSLHFHVYFSRSESFPKTKYTDLYWLVSSWFYLGLNENSLVLRIKVVLPWKSFFLKKLWIDWSNYLSQHSSYLDYLREFYMLKKGL